MEQDLKEFFWQHMLNDLRALVANTKRNEDELLILLHLISFSFLKTDTHTEARLNFEEKFNRNDWETEFSKTCIAPVLSSIDNSLIQANNAINNNNNTEGSIKSKIYFMAYEILPEDPNKTNFAYENVEYWKFVPSVSFHNMSIEFINSNESIRNNFPTLKRFIELKSKLSRIENLTKMISLISFLNTLSISSHKAHNITIVNFLNESACSGSYY